MKRYVGSQKVDPGLFFDARRVSFRSMEREGRLPGAADDVYYRVPTPVLLVVGPLLGLVFVVFLPFIGLAMVTWLLLKKAAAGAAELRQVAARVVAPAWKPGMAFLSRAKRPRKRNRTRDRWAEKTRKKLDEPPADD